MERILHQNHHKDHAGLLQMLWKWAESITFVLVRGIWLRPVWWQCVKSIQAS